MNKKISILVIAVLSVLLTATVFPAIEARDAVAQSTSTTRSSTGTNSWCNNLLELINDYKELSQEMRQKAIDTGMSIYQIMSDYCTAVADYLQEVYNAICGGSGGITGPISADVAQEVLQYSSIDPVDILFSSELSIGLNIMAEAEGVVESVIASSASSQECSICASR